jgi:hypothetical protein
MFDVVESRTKKRPDLHRGYLPVAVFVTAYGRLKLWRELNKLGKRVVMYDTDSIIYAPSIAEYNIPEGNCLGDWETEKFQTKNGGIGKFVSIGPKSYCITANNGQEEMKLKGVSLKYAHERMINGSIMEDVLKRGRVLSLPQLNFDYEVNKGISTRKFTKTIEFIEANVKGDYRSEEFRRYPYGFQE